MHHGGGPPNVQRNLQRTKSFTGSEAEEQQQPQQSQQQQQQPMPVTQQQPANHPQSPVTSFAPSASPSAPQSPNYQIIMSRSPVTGQNMNITLQNVGPMVPGNQQITLASLPLQSPASPGFQHQPQQWRFEPGSSSYIQVTSPLSQTLQPQSPTQHSPVPIQAVPRPNAPVSALGVCGQSPTRFVDAGIMVRQLNLGSPPAHFVYQDGAGLAQLTPTTAGAVQLTSPGTPGAIRERRLSQPHSQTGGTIHHLGPQSPVAAGAALPTLGSPGHITTSNLPPQISSIIQGQLARPMIFEKTAQVVVGASAAPSFGVPSAIPPSSPSRSNPPQGLAGQSMTPTTSVKKMQPKKLEEIAPSNPEVAQLRKQCLEHHGKKMDSLKEVFKEYLIELFFLQHLQGNMMDYIAFKKKPCVPLFTYLRQNDLDLEDEEEEEEQSEVINDEVKVVTGKDGQTVTPVAIATQLPPNVSAAFSVQQQFQTQVGVAGGSISNPADMEAFKRQQAMAQADQAKRSRMEVGRHGMIFQHPAVTALGSTGVPLQQLMPTAQGGMPPTPQTVQIGGQKQNQQQYDPSKGPPVQNAASLHTPPPQLPGRLPQGGIPMAGLPLSLSQGQAMLVDQQAPMSGGQLQVKVQGTGAVLAPVNPHAQLQAQLQQMQSGLHLQMQQQQQQMQQSVMQPGQATVTLVRPGSDSSQPAQRLMSNSFSNAAMSPAPLTSPSSLPSPHPSVPVRTPCTGPSLSSVAQSKLASTNGTTGLKMSGLGQNPVGQNSQESSQDKQAEQAKLESHVHQRISELRKEGQWSASRLPKLQEACRPKSHWDYLLEEMQWMAADFAQERRWKIAAAKKLVRTCSRYHDEQKKMVEREKREEEMRLRHIASTIARGVDYFWSNIEQVVEIKLRFEIYDKQQKVLGLQKAASKGHCAKPAQSSREKSDKESKGETGPSRKRKSSTSLSDVEVEDEESTIEEQEATEGTADQKAELADLTKEAEVPLDDLVKQYAGAYAEGFEWPQPSIQSEDEDREEADDMNSPLNSPHEAVLIDSLLSVDQYRGAERMASGSDGKPTKDIAEVAAATDLILPKGSARTTLTSRSSPPALLHGSLREYQQVGVEWLANLYRKNLNGILADETGLGKTVQTVAYFAHLACNQGIWGPHLVVVRTCKLLNWEMEFKRWCPGLKILLYLGSRRQRRYKRLRWCEPNSFHVCVTSYKLLLKDQSHFMRRRWRHLVLDEVQLIKNMTEKHWETIFNIKSQQRILLINTPLQNTLKELWTMIHFLLPGITHPYLSFPIKPGTDQNQDYCHKLVIRLHRMIQPFILRRSKRDVEKQMPKKYEHILKCRLSKRQKSMYEDILIQPSAQEALKTGHFVRVLEVLMQLQKICNHPDLIQPRDTHNSYICQPLQYNTPSLLLTALQQDQWKTVDMSLFDLISNEGKLTRYEAEETLPKLRMTKQLIEEIYSARDPPARPRPCKIKPMRLFQPVQYGTKPEGRLVPMTSSTTPAPRATAVTTAPTTTTNPVTAAPSTQPRGKSPLTTTTSAQTSAIKSSTGPLLSGATPNPLSTPLATGVTGVTAMTAVTPHAPAAHPLQPSLVTQRLVLSSQAQARLPSGDVVKVAQLVGQGRITQPETPVTLQFQGNKFTLSPSQLRQLTTGQPLQLQGTLGNILQIVSAPGQSLLRPQGPPMVMPTVPQAVPVQNSSGTPPPATSTPQAANMATTVTPATTDTETNAKHSANATTQESSEERNRQLKERLASLLHANDRRSSRSVLYGSDLIKTCSIYVGRPPPAFPAPQHSRWSWVGRDSCIRAQQTCVSTVAPLRSAILSNTEQEEAACILLKRFSCILPAAVAPPPQLYASNPPPFYSIAQKSFRRKLQEVSAPHNAEIRKLACPPVTSFPDKRMLEMDSGKLEALSILLQKLSVENKRVLIFTQMASMLDILEAFLDHHHLTYVRLDESLSLEERRVQVKRFNRNRQIFCTILTNRCCSAMGHVFDADTIVFYDTDLNPSMDMRTQEWCDKIGRSKDIHIYRLESGNSIEEKLLKNGTKDLIREVAAQGMDYTLAFLTQRTIQDLFEVEAGSGEKVEEFVVLHQEPSPSESIPPHVARPYIQALNTIRLDTQYEDEEEKTEVNSDKEEVGGQKEIDVEEETSQLEELAAVMEQLTPIERYALHYLEYLHISEDEQVIKERIEAAKRGWELQQQQKVKVEKEEQMILEDEEDLFTYTREDAYNMEYVFENEDGQTELMPLWTPPTPPQDDNDIYIDSVICLMYDTAPMPESKLPPVYVRKERKRHMDPSALGRKKKKGHGESVIPPRSLFDKASLLKVRREGKDQKKNFSLKQQAPFAKPLPSLLKPAMEAGQDNPEWLISEDWALLQAVKQLLELPLNLTIVSPAHTPNWDLVSDVVNSCSRIYRSPKQCRSRYENVIIPREEGKLIYEANPKKNKTKSIYKSKNSRPLRTCQIYTQDDNATQIQLYNSRFELMKIIASKRSPPIKPLLGMNPFQKNPKHASVLAESGISYDKPLPPIQVASQRAERIAKEKKALAEQQRAQQLAQQQQQQTTGAAQPQGAAAQAQAQPQATAAGTQVTGVPQPNQPGATAVANTAVLTGAIKTTAVGTSIQPATATVSGNVIVNTVAGVPPGQFQANKRLASPVIPGALSTAGTATAQVVHTQQRPVPTTAAPAEVVTIATGQSVRAVTPVTASAVVSTNLTPGQSQTRTLVAPAPGMQLPQGKQLTPAQFQLIRQQHLQQQQQQQQQPQATSPQIKAVGKPQQELLKKQKLQMAAVAQGQQAASTQQPQQVHTTPAATGNPQIAAVAAPRPGAVLTGTTVTNLQVTRLTRVQAQGTIQAQQGPTAQVTLTKPPPVVSVPAVVSSAGVTTLPVTVAGISVAIGQTQKTGGQVVTHPFQVQQVQQLLNRQKQQAAAQAAVQKAAQPQQTQATVQQKAAQTTAQQQQKVTYAATTQLQPGIKTQFFTTSIAQPQKPATAQQIQVAKLPQIVQQQIVSSPQQIQPQTVALTQAAPAAGSGQAQVQVIPAGTATATQVVQQKLLQQQIVTAAAVSPQIQTPPPHSPAQQQSATTPTSETPAQQAAATPQPQQGKGNTRTGVAMRSKTPAKPSGGS
ncbi:E1A-binding protein p400 isoform X2 [Pimephales promelas]|uniref:E1A-binding protein p400 isoform X2 n=1 Tax=Pimephales promelas TaxID=90988 RepID=UPI0019557B55|nr:E1A-binding protein p400 isoform X2 [Pimephales promelas]